MTGGGELLINTSSPTRKKPYSHDAVDPPICKECQELDLSFFDPTCIGCRDILTNPRTTVSELFAIIRQWVPQTQQNIDILVKEILQRGAHVNDRDGLTDMTLLHYAAKSGANGVGDINTSCRVVKMLIENGVDTKAKCRWTNMSALHYAVFFDIEPIVKILLEVTDSSDVDYTCKDFDNGTALHIGCANISSNSVKTLIDFGANPHYRNKLGKLPIDCIPSVSDLGADHMVDALRNELTTAMKKTEPNRKHNLSVSTLQALGLELHDQVVVAGKVGVLRFCGSTDFASGQWAGIELDEPIGKNDGSIAGVRYFTCEPKHGIFAPLTRVNKYDGTILAPLSSFTPTSSISRASTADSGKRNLTIGDRVIVARQKVGFVRYLGPTKFSSSTWVGVELDEAAGKNDGSVAGVRYFSCEPKHGVFAPLPKVQRIPDDASLIDASQTTADSLDQSTVTKLKISINTGNEGKTNNGFHSCENDETKMKEIEHESATEEINQPEFAQTEKQRGISYQESSENNSSKGHVNDGSKKNADISSRINRDIQLATKVKKSTTVDETFGARINFTLNNGMSVYVNNELGIVRFIGRVEFSDGIWLGIELRKPNGRNDGMVENKRYFSCKPKYGLMVRPNRATCRGISCAQLVDLKFR